MYRWVIEAAEDEVRARAVWRLGNLVVRRGEIAEGESSLRAALEAGVPEGGWDLGDLCAQRGDSQQAAVWHRCAAELTEQQMRAIYASEGEHLGEDCDRPVEENRTSPSLEWVARRSAGEGSSLGLDGAS